MFNINKLFKLMVNFLWNIRYSATNLSRELSGGATVTLPKEYTNPKIIALIF